MTLLVTRDRNPTQTRLSTKGNLLAHSTQKHAKASHRKEEKTTGIRVFKIRKRVSLVLEFSLSSPYSSLHVAGKMAPADTRCHLPGLKSTRERDITCHPWTSVLLGREGSVTG